MSICDKLFLRSLSILDATTDTDDMIIPIKKTSSGSVGICQNISGNRIIVQAYALAETAGTVCCIKRLLYQERIDGFFLLHQLRPDNGLRGLFWRTIGK